MKKSINHLSIILTVFILLIAAIAAPLLAKSPVQKVDHSIQCNDSCVAGSSYPELVILAPSYFKAPLTTLVHHKEQMGIPTALITLDSVYEQMYWQGRDQAEKIKYFIKSAVEEWNVSYILLIGGMKGQRLQWHCPVRYVQMGCDWESQYISDLYYADLYDANGSFSSWDTDHDGLYGEWYYEETAEDYPLDLTPDVAVGRLPCRNVFELRMIVDKIISYEKYSYGMDWFNRFVIAAGDTYPETQNPLWKGYEGEVYGDRAIENLSKFTPIRLYTSEDTFTNPQDLRRQINKGCGFLYLVGHGSPKKWGNNMPNGSEFIDGLNTINSHLLKNRNRYPVCVLSGCHNLQFDVSILRSFDPTAWYHQENILECLGWQLTWNKAGGSIATLGTTALGFTKEDKDSFTGGINEIEVEFFKQYGQNNKTILGDAWKAAVEWYTTTYQVNWNTISTDDSWIDVQVPQTWILFGDPSLQIGGYPQKDTYIV